mmetsp:Transcript_3122/g.5849  ORF Transcript_3122/g.5849 Transcript_3122/m.5849 type:complete len:272 (-) Transcript_3122:849-1664(-)
MPSFPPPAGFDMMIWSTRSTVMAASTASLKALSLVCRRSTMSFPASLTPLPSPVMSTPAEALPLAWAAVRAARMSVGSWPEFSARVLGTNSRALAKLRMAYWSSPGQVSPKALILWLSSISVAPAPGTRAPLEQQVLMQLTPSSTARSRSLRTDSVEARRRMVATLHPSLALSFCAKMTTFLPPISLTLTSSQNPISSAVAGPRRTRAVDPVAEQMRLSSHLETILTHIIPYLSMKCMAISETVPPEMTTLVPVSAMALMISSIFFSSDLL